MLSAHSADFLWGAGAIALRAAGARALGAGRIGSMNSCGCSGMPNRCAPPRSDLCDPHPFRRTALQPAVNLALCYTAEQGLLPRCLDISDVWEGLPVGLKRRQGTSGA